MGKAAFVFRGGPGGYIKTHRERIARKSRPKPPKSAPKRGEARPAPVLSGFVLLSALVKDLGTGPSPRGGRPQ